MKRDQFKHKLTNVFWYCRWLSRYPNGDWTIIGIHKRWSGWDEYSYSLCFFGFECRIWFKIEIKN